MREPMLRTRLLAVELLIIVLLSASLTAGDTDKSAADWPQWRGPHRDGLADDTGLLQRWSPEGPPLAWKTSGLGEGYASVVIADVKIFTMGRRKNVVFVVARD